MFEDWECPGSSDDDVPFVSMAGVFGAHPDGLEWLLCEDVSAQTWQALEYVALRPLSAPQRVLYAELLDRHVQAAQAMFQKAVVRATTRCPSTPPAAHLETEVGLALRRSAASTDRMVAFAHRVVRSLPVMFSLLEKGDVSIAHVRALDELTEVLDDAHIETIDEQVSRRAAALTVPAFRRVVARAVAAIDPESAAKRHEKAKRDKTGARLYPQPDGMTTLAVTMPAADGIRALAALNERADLLREPEETRSHGERVVEGLARALAAPLGGEGKVRFRRSAHVVATIDLASLLGLRDKPGEIRGYGPVSAEQVRAMLAEEGTMLHRLVYDEVTGKVLDYQVRGYHPDEVLREFVSARDVTCRFPGCTRNAVYCDLEHCEEYDGDECGATSCANCGLMCRRHHNQKTTRAVDYTRADPQTGETVWETALGLRYRQAAARYTPTGPDTGDTESLGLKKQTAGRTSGDGTSGAPPF
jgi:hypothetical protein